MISLPFLTAEWRDLVVANYEIDPTILRKYLPNGTELDLVDGKAYVSLVAFKFQKTRLLGIIPVSFAKSFEEINLRFYIKRTVDGECRRAVAFIKEVVPSHLVAFTARALFNEPYVALPTAHTHKIENDNQSIRYEWKDQGREMFIQAQCSTQWKELVQGSFSEFILEHYWGYTNQYDGSTDEYRVAHPPWKCSEATSYEISDSIQSFYGKDFESTLSKTPVSVFVAEGSEICVSFGRKLDVASIPPSATGGPLGWVLYDGHCGFCSWWIPYWKNAIRKAGYDIAPLQAEWVRNKIHIEEPELSNDIRLLLRDGRLINGADAYIYGMNQVWWSRPVGFLLKQPLLRQLTWLFYRIFNKNRFLVSSVCRLKPEI